VKHVYLLESLRFPKQRYKGFTDNVNARLQRHNDGEVPSTRPYRPWRLVLSTRFADDNKAAAFEQYLKSGSGHAFAERHFW
jgi:putative endonuclease